MGLTDYLPIIAAAGAGRARGKFNRQELDREEMQQALVEHHRQTGEQLERRRLDNQDRDRRDVLKFRMDDATERGKDRDADREARKEIARQQSADRGETRDARTQARELRPDQREQAAQEFAYGLVEAAGGDPIAAMRAGERDMPTAKKLGLRRDHYYAGAQRFKDRFTPKDKPTRFGNPKGAVPRTSAPKVPTDAQKARAAGDPEYKQFLLDTGYSF